MEKRLIPQRLYLANAKLNLSQFRGTLLRSQCKDYLFVFWKLTLFCAKMQTNVFILLPDSKTASASSNSGWWKERGLMP